MFGKSILKLIGIAVAGAISLAIGAQLLSSVVSIVLAFRYGNVVPLLSVVIVTISLLLISNRIPKDSPSQIIWRVLTYAATGYLAVVAFVISLPYGLIASIVATSTVGALFHALTDQKKLLAHVRRLRISQGRFNRSTSRTIPIGDGQSYKADLHQYILLLEQSALNRVVRMMKERPLLPISVTHYEECDVLFINERQSSEKYDRIIKLLIEYQIETRGPASSLLAEAIQLIPVLDSKNGLRFDDYRFTRDSSTIEFLLEKAPVRLTVFPSLQGLGILVPDIDAPGMEVEEISHGHEVDVLLLRDYSYLEEAEKQIESPA